MMSIDASRPSPLDRLAIDYLSSRQATPSLDFCRRTLGVQADDKTIAKRLGVALSTVRQWQARAQEALP